MKKIVIFSILAAVLLFGCTNNDSRTNQATSLESNVTSNEHFSSLQSEEESSSSNKNTFESKQNNEDDSFDWGEIV